MNANCHVEPIQKVTTTDELQSLTTVGLAIWGMGCVNCATRVRNALLALTGVVEADVDHATGFASVEYSQNLASLPALLQAVAQAGDGEHHKYIAMLLDSTTQSEPL